MQSVFEPTTAFAAHGCGLLYFTLKQDNEEYLISDSVGSSEYTAANCSKMMQHVE